MYIGNVSKIFQMYTVTIISFPLINVQTNWMTVAILKTKTYLKLKGLQVVFEMRY